MADRHGRVADPRWNLTAVNCYIKEERASLVEGESGSSSENFCSFFRFQVTRPPRESLPFLDSLRTHSSAWDCAQLYSTLPYCCLVRLTGSASVAVGLSPQSSFVRSREIEAN